MRLAGGDSQVGPAARRGRDSRRHPAGRPRPVLLAGYGAVLEPYGGRVQKVMGLQSAKDGETLTIPPMRRLRHDLTVWMKVLPR